MDSVSKNPDATKRWNAMERIRFDPEIHMIADNDGDFHASVEEFLAACSDSGVKPVDVEPQIAEWQSATIDGSSILKAIEDQIPEEDAEERATTLEWCQVAAAEANKILSNANIGGYIVIDKVPAILGVTAKAIPAAGASVEVDPRLDDLLSGNSGTTIDLT